MNEMRKLMEAVSDYDLAKDIDHGVAGTKRRPWKKGQFVQAAVKYQMRVTTHGDIFGVEWQDENGKIRYEERASSQIRSLDDMVQFALDEMK